MATSKRLTITVPEDVLLQLDFASAKMQISRSAFVSGLLVNSLPSLCSVLAKLPDVPEDATDGHSRRFRGEAVRVISRQLSDVISGDSDA